MAEDESFSPAIHGLEFPSRALCARLAETDEIHFLAATQSVTSENQIHLLTYNDENSELDKYIYAHPAGEVWDIKSSPFKKDIISSVYSRIEGGKQRFFASLWTLPDEQATLTEGLSDADDSRGVSPRNRKSSVNTAVTKLCNIEGLEGRVSVVCWDPKEGSNAIICIDESTVKLYKLDNDISQLISCNTIPTEEKKHINVNAVFNPHLGLIDCITSGEAVTGLDFRVSKPVFSISRPHSLTTRDVDFNPNKPYHIATGGDDCQVKFWDIRQLTNPLITRKDHTHWVWGVQYNPNHDQLVISCSSDSNVALSRLTSIASDPIPILDEDFQDTPAKPPQPDELIMTYDVHEDSVYKIQWSSANSWVFASLSYDGRLAINHVPHSETLKILL
ncbi:Protein TSSC1 [Oopsacas minuta]|uniref:Protein TSSC1 n=1 Tax=Oopsacas minuta TaxID=111878 RepID=A0AAV7K1B5_9METZ|nr:Protein TSSC1 [Oopsacas minuta]